MSRLAKMLPKKHKFKVRETQPLPAVRSSARVHAQVRHVPPVLPRSGAQGRDAGRHQVELVRTLAHVDDRSHRRFSDAHPQRHPEPASSSIDCPRLEAEAAHRRDPPRGGLRRWRDQRRRRASGQHLVDAALRRLATSSAITGIAPGVAPGPAPLRRRQGAAQGPQRPRHRHHVHLPWRDDRPARPASWASAARSSARSGRQAMSRIGKKPIADSKGVTVKHRRRDAVGEGPQGPARRWPVHRKVERQGRGRASWSAPAATTAARRRAAHGLMRALAANMVTGRQRPASSASSRSTASATAPRSRARSWSCSLGYSHPVEYKLPERCGRQGREERRDR